MTIGERIKQRRIELNLTQEELAKRLGNKTRASVCTVERDKEDLTTTRIMMYAKALECTPAYLMGWEDAEKKITGKTPEENKQALITRMVMDDVFWNYAKLMYFLPQHAKEKVYDFIDYTNDREANDGNS